MTEKKPAISRKLLELRKRAKNKKPEFLRSESWRYSKMSKSWRRPRGLDHKMRRKIKGWPPMVSTGYKGPKPARGLHPSGFREIAVHNVDELALIDPSIQAARIAHTVGKKKRSLIMSAAKERKIRILNPGAIEKAEESSEVLAEGEESTVETEAKAKQEKPSRGLFKRNKPAEEDAPAKEAPLEQPKKTRKTARKTKVEEKNEGTEKQ